MDASRFLRRAVLGVLCCAASMARAAPGEVERGRYLATVGDCVACHTAPGGRPFAGGRAIDTGFGLVYTPNITPDKATGIGGWSDDDFWRAMHEGRDDEGRHLYPAFPYPWFTKVSRADVGAIKAYLDSLAPVHQPNRPPQLDWWVSWRALMGPWNVLNFDAGEFRADPTKSAQWNRGAYLVQGLGHCGDCHTPKRTFGGPERSRALEGGSWLGWYAPPLAGAGRGLRDWSRDEIVEFLKTGSTARTASLGRMSEVVEHSTSHFSDDDLRAVATYLKELPAARADDADVPPLPDSAAMARGEALFVDQCSGCHMADGHGMAGAFPPLAGNPSLQGRDADNAIRVVLEGARMVATAAKPTALAMPAFDWKLDDAEIADVVDYVRNAWGNHGAPVDADAVARMRGRLAHERATASR